MDFITQYKKAKRVGFGLTVKKIIDKSRLKKINDLRKNEIIGNGFQSGIDFSNIKLVNKLSFKYLPQEDEYRDSIIDKAELAAKGYLKILSENYFNFSVYKEKYFLQNPVGKNFLKMFGADYSFINWQLDPKSGYEYNPTLWHRDIKISPEAGVEIKMPWELGRISHLMDFWLASLILKKENQPDQEKFIRAGEQRIVDFILSNPVGLGVQWSCAMDVAIRAAQISIFVDLSTSIGVHFEEYFLELVKKSLAEHIVFVYQNFEWSSGMRGNHYLANLCGIIVTASYLDNSGKIDSILKFCINELAEEIMYQFLPDGGNFEASTRYHLFSSEMVLTALIFASNLAPERLKRIADSSDPEFNRVNKIRKTKFLKFENGKIILSNELTRRLENIIRFGKSISSSSGTLPQIGDNDSGTFLTFIPYFEDNGVGSIQYPLFNSLVDYFTNNFSLVDKPSFWNYDILSNSFEALKKSLRYGKAGFESYPDFGLIKRQTAFYELFFRCGDTGQNGKGGHAHCDALSFMLKIGTDEVMGDPGTFCYTSNPVMRNKFRSGDMHNILAIEGKEQYFWDNKDIHDLFWIVEDKAKARIFEANEYVIAAEHTAFGNPCKRKLELLEDTIVGTDSLNTSDVKFIRFHLYPGFIPEMIETNTVQIKVGDRRVRFFSENGVLNIKKYLYSREYGISEEALCIEISGNETIFVWKLSIENEIN